jgi:penicillin-binding protein 2
MKKLVSILILILMFSTGCIDTTIPSAPKTTHTVIPTITTAPTAITDIASSENVGRTFLTAWEEENYSTMYELLAPSLRTGLSQNDFEQAHRAPLNITTAISITLAPQTLSVDGNQAWIEFDEIWHTGMFGDIKNHNQLDLIKENDEWWINWRKHTIWPELTDGNTFAVEYQIPPRANIYDRNNAGLATPVTIVTIGLIPEQIEDEPAVLGALTQILAMTIEEIQALYLGQPSNWYIPIGDITGEQSLTYDELLSQPGIERRERTGRLYPLNGTGAHVTGWVSPIPAEAYENYRQRGYRGDERVGISGLEAWGESILAGQNGGRLYIVNQEGEYVQGLAERQPIRGHAIHTTLDRDLQHYAEQMLGNRRGAVVALDIRTGAVLALTSGPHFDNNIFIRPSDDYARQIVLNDPNRPLLNRAVQGLYPSGSVFKIVTLAAGLEAGNLTAHSGFTCPGYWDGLGSPNRKFCWSETGHGNITLKDALSASCNVTFYEVGKLLHNAGEDILPTYGKAFGLGQMTGLPELPEAEGLMPDAAWKKDIYHTAWATGDAVNLAIGQGYLLVTPLQIARMVAAVANGGTLYRPYIVERIAEGNGQPEQFTLPQAVGQLPISPDNLAIIQDAMLGTTTQAFGTVTHRYAGLGIPIAGKTGTAEGAHENDEPHSWFAGYFPANDPEIAMVIVVENAGEGSTVAAPMFRQIVEAYHNLPITPLPEPSEAPTGD